MYGDGRLLPDGGMGEEEGDDLFGAIAEEEQVVVGLAVGKLTDDGVKEGVDLVTLAAQKDHGAVIVVGGVMVLGGVHKNLLGGACAAGCEDDAVEADGQEGIFADAVGEVLGDVGGKEVAGFMAVEPCGDGEALGPIGVEI